MNRVVIAFDFGMDLQEVNILISSVSAKVGLVRAFTEIPPERRGRIIGIDANPDAVAGRYCDRFIHVPSVDSQEYWPEIARICSAEKIALVVPTREEEMLAWRLWFDAAGTDYPKLAASSAACLEVACDKWHTYRWLKQKGYPTPETIEVWSVKADPERMPGEAPWFAKNPKGSGGRQVAVCETPEDVLKVPNEWVVQPKLAGDEYTINFYVDPHGRCRSVVPHRRLEVVDGEVQRAETVKAQPLLELAQRLAADLPGVYGPFNFQVFWEGGDSSPMITDLNPRFGGGYPLAHAAGVRFPEWLVRDAVGLDFDATITGWQNGLKMGRFRESVFFGGDED